MPDFSKTFDKMTSPETAKIHVELSKNSDIKELNANIKELNKTLLQILGQLKVR